MTALARISDQLPQLFAGYGVLVLASLLAAAVAQPENGGLGVGREVAIVRHFLRLADDRQDLHVGRRRRQRRQLHRRAGHPDARHPQSRSGCLEMQV
jgi:hypothetical protein